jgi:hypothetical protein
MISNFFQTIFDKLKKMFFEKILTQNPVYNLDMCWAENCDIFAKKQEIC